MSTNFKNNLQNKLLNFRKKNINFVLLGTQRSGTTLLLEYLESHPEIYMARELFKIHGEGKNVDQENYRHQDVPVSDYLDKFYKSRKGKYTASGFKLMLDQLDSFYEIFDYLKKNRIYCLYMERKNVLKTCVSRLLARENNLYHSNTDVTNSPVYLQADVIEDEMEKIQLTLKKAHEIIPELNCHTVYYEDLIENTTEVLDKIQGFLKVKKQGNLFTQLKKINDDDLNNVILNYKEIYLKLINKDNYSEYLTPLKKNNPPYTALNDIYKCIFIHIPKVAGSSIEKAIFGTWGEIGHHYAVHYKEADPDKFKNYYSFAFVRNPFDRLVSSYFYLRNGGRNKYDSEWSNKYLSNYSSFESFILSLGDLSTQKEITDWVHFKPQYLFVCDNESNIIVDFIGKYENLENDFNKVIKKLGIETSLLQENTSERKSYETYYNENTRDIVREIYQKDFELFGYATECVN